VTESTKRPVIICTEFRGVFFGYAEDTTGSDVTLSDARNCIYWDSKVGGFIGLASKGPNKNCRIGETAASLDLRKVTAVLEVSAEAEAAWQSAPVYRG